MTTSVDSEQKIVICTYILPLGRMKSGKCGRKKGYSLIVEDYMNTTP